MAGELRGEPGPQVVWGCGTIHGGRGKVGRLWGMAGGHGHPSHSESGKPCNKGMDPS